MLVPNQSIALGELSKLFRREFELCKVHGGETVAILSGPQTNPDYVQAAFVAAGALGARPFGVRIDAPQREATAVPGAGEIYGLTGLSGLRPAVEALKRADMVIDLVLLLHSAEQHEILDAGARMLLICEPPEILERMLPTDDLRRRAEASARLLGAAREIQIRSDAGTDVSMPLGEFGAGGGWGYCDKKGEWAHWPSGMTATYPNEGGAHGTVVIDRGDIIFPFKTYVQSPITLRIRDGFIVAIDGELDAELYRDYLESWGDPEGFAVSHIGWGVNEKALWNALAIIDRAATQGMDGRCFYGNVLFSTGPNNDVGGKRFTLAHSDVPLRNCSVWLDGEQVLDHGEFLVDELKTKRPHHRLTSTNGRVLAGR